MCFGNRRDPHVHRLRAVRGGEAEASDTPGAAGQRAARFRGKRDCASAESRPLEASPRGRRLRGSARHRVARVAPQPGRHDGATRLQLHAQPPFRDHQKGETRRVVEAARRDRRAWRIRAFGAAGSAPRVESRALRFHARGPVRRRRPLRHRADHARRHRHADRRRRARAQQKCPRKFRAVARFLQRHRPRALRGPALHFVRRRSAREGNRDPRRSHVSARRGFHRAARDHAPAERSQKSTSFGGP